MSEERREGEARHPARPKILTRASQRKEEATEAGARTGRAPGGDPKGKAKAGAKAKAREEKERAKDGAKEEDPTNPEEARCLRSSKGWIRTPRRDNPNAGTQTPPEDANTRDQVEPATGVSTYA